MRNWKINSQLTCKNINLLTSINRVELTIEDIYFRWTICLVFGSAQKYHFKCFELYKNMRMRFLLTKFL